MKKICTVDESVNKDVILRVRLSPHLDNELTRYADKWECKRSELVRVVLLNFINEMEERGDSDNNLGESLIV